MKTESFGAKSCKHDLWPMGAQETPMYRKPRFQRKGHTMTVTIEHHYNMLKSEAEYARSIIVADLGRLPENNRHTELKARICDRATELAEQDWPRVRSSLAAKGETMPLGPLTFGSSGYTQHCFSFGGSICGSREKLGCEPDYPSLAYAALRPNLAREADAAEAAFEAYRRAVEQGVAIAPQGS